MRVSISLHRLVGLLLLSSAPDARSEIVGLERVAAGLSAPIYVTHAPGDFTRLFVAERGGQVRILDFTSGAVLATPFLSTPVDTSGEGGLLGMAFHPDYAKKGLPGTGKLYLNVTTASPFTTRILEFTTSATDPDVADPTPRQVLAIAQPHINHNGGWLGFSPIDGYLYVPTGDGASGNDPGDNAQDLTDNLLGKILRLDVDGDDFPYDPDRNYAIPPTNPFVGASGDDEIWARGLRNPFRASFDRATGDLWIGDVGARAREEIDFQPATSDGGENYGWRLREGRIATPDDDVGGPRPPDNVDPVYDYDRDDDAYGGRVVTGGYVYRGPDPDLRGQYFFLDSRNTVKTDDDNYWRFDPADPFATVENIDALLVRDSGSAQFPVSFGEDAAANLYVAYIASGEVYRIRTTVVPEPHAAAGLVAAGALRVLASRRRRREG